jgi:hypothetical protein
MQFLLQCIRKAEQCPRAAIHRLICFFAPDYLRMVYCEGAGVGFIDENGGGPGVRLRKERCIPERFPTSRPLAAPCWRLVGIDA